MKSASFAHAVFVCPLSIASRAAFNLLIRPCFCCPLSEEIWTLFLRSSIVADDVFTVTVKTSSATIDDLKNSVQISSLSGQQKQGLISKLNAALDAIDKGHTNTACAKLADFINSVQNYVD